MKNRSKMPIKMINNLMSLRLPQYESLQILDDIMQANDLSLDLKTLEKQIHNNYPIFKEFEREFPSLTFAIATGVGKTRLMGAFITYLYLNYDIKNFFIIAPNLTIYNKLIRDFGEPNYSKYVFKGLQAFAQNLPNVITGDNYKDFAAGQQSLFNSITINIFNIGKINAEVRSGNLPQIKRLSEYIGQSYFEYLSKLTDLVVLMDESHHYRADRGMAVINELEPLLGLELTATPQVETSKGAIKFRNVVYEYSLAKAISDGFVKTPAVATRKNFDTAKYNADETDKIKLIDGIIIHRNTKAELQAYAENENVKLIKPFVLVVCKDTIHAAAVKEYITSDEFFEGYYKNKVIEVHSNQSGGEKDENIQRLLSLEDENNTTEIVIHVNMLKEGWDVTNLYTIIPLRTATSLTLREQTIGRGLRLPYGKVTGNAAVDRLTIVAHDKFEEIIKAANDENSIIKKENIITIEDNDDLGKEKEIVKSKTVFDRQIEESEQKLKFARSDEKKEVLRQDIEISKAVGQAIEEILTQPVNITFEDKAVSETLKDFKMPDKFYVMTTQDLEKPEIQEVIKVKAKEKLEKNGQITFEFDDISKKIESAIAPVVEQKKRFSINIPNIAVVAKGAAKVVYNDFDLDTRYFSDYRVSSNDIVIENLQTNETEILSSDTIFEMPDKPENMILSEMLNADTMIDYEENAELLYKLISQALKVVSNNKDEKELIKSIIHYKIEIAREILKQIRENSELKASGYEIKVLQFSSPILSEDYTKFKADEIVKFTNTIPEYAIKKTVVGGFSKACHDVYKFDSVPEHKFSVVLERSLCVEKWLHPALGQFKINWGAAQTYQPDFVVETKDCIYIVEVKAYLHSEADEVKLKAQAAQTYCDNVNKIFAGQGIKTWRYLMIVDREIDRSKDFKDFLRFI